ncbi:MAG: hypothetical protein IJE97_13820, partial [Thermoguttaceae bacterium]|nr:hypothetical protein [Thermoguttaceae bacterium]
GLYGLLFKKFFEANSVNFCVCENRFNAVKTGVKNGKMGKKRRKNRLGKICWPTLEKMKNCDLNKKNVARNCVRDDFFDCLFNVNTTRTSWKRKFGNATRCKRR